jgi:hypothetical protein
MQEGNRRMVWRFYGWFCGLMCLGAVSGAVAWLAYMQNLVALFNQRRHADKFERAAWDAKGQYWTSIHYVTYSIEFLCLSVAKLLILDRMVEFSMSNTDNGLQKRVDLMQRFVLATVVAGNIVSLCANIAAAQHMIEAHDFNNFASKNQVNPEATDYLKRAVERGETASKAMSVQQVFEVAVLIIIIISFIAVGIASARRLRSALQSLNKEQEAAGRHMQRQIIGTIAFVFVTFILRAVLSIMTFVANALQNDHYDEKCDNNYCDPKCYNEFAMMQFWLKLTPEFTLTVHLISSPLTMLVCLWGMTSKRALHLMTIGSKRESIVHSVQELASSSSLS